VFAASVNVASLFLPLLGRAAELASLRQQRTLRPDFLQLALPAVDQAVGAAR
jgi:hypothetical protein